MDEATSALDSATEQMVMQRLMAEHRDGRTMLIVAHRTAATPLLPAIRTGSWELREKADPPERPRQPSPRLRPLSLLASYPRVRPGGTRVRRLDDKGWRASRLPGGSC